MGRYALLSRIASGGMGEVFIAQAHDAAPDEPKVAVKLLLPHLSERPEFVQMFLDEARIAARMNHPNVVRIFDLGEAEGRYFVAMTLVEGVSLSALLNAARARQVVLPLPVGRLVAQGLCAGLAHAHGLRDPSGRPFNLIHRDVTPHNVLISTSGQVVLTDFGIAKAAGNLHHTRTGVVRGKYAYIAPEQLAAASGGARVDQRADLFSAAVTLFETFTCVSPFAREDDVATMDAIKAEPLPDLLELREDASAELKVALEQATERDPELRFSTARELGEALCRGPLATPGELGEVVRSLCGDDLRAFSVQGVQTGEALPRGEGTAALALVSDTLSASGPRAALSRTAQLTQRIRRSPLWTIAVLALLTFAAVAALGWRRLSSDAELVEPDAVVAGPVPGQGMRAAPSEEEPSGPIRGAATVRSGSPQDAPRPGRSEAAAEAPTATIADHPTRAPDPGPPPVATATGTPGAAPTAGAVPAEPKPSATAAGDDSLAVITEPLRVGYLTADATPWADVLVDGARVDRTPLARYPLRVGAHSVVFRHPTLGKVEKRITIQEGQVSRVRAAFPRR